MTFIEFKVLDQLDGKDKISVTDEYLLRMNAYERAMKIGINEHVSLENFVEFLKDNVCEWTKEEKDNLNYAIDQLKIQLLRLNIDHPSVIYIIKTSGKDEWNSAYTRSNKIILPDKKLRTYSKEELFELLSHEFFHIYSRFNEEKRERLYGLLGFKFLDNNFIPKEIKELCLVNPDALQDVYTEVVYKDHIVKVSPLVMIKNKEIDVTTDIIESIKFKLYVIETGELIDTEDINGYIERISINTTNIQHPEETLAENFNFMILGKQNLPNPGFISAIRNIIKEH